jgi:hypothetical protein
MKTPYLILALLFISSISHAGDLKPFKSDGCSAFPDGTNEQKDLWLKCCVEHDKKYWKGGTYEERKMADLELKQCVESVNEPDIAQLMLAGVRVGGTPYFPTSFRWGYGWPYPRGYQSLSDEERREVELKSKSESYNNALIQKTTAEEHNHE